MKTMVIGLALVLVCATTAGALPDPNNTGVFNDEPTFERPEFDGLTDFTQVVLFPTAADNWDVEFYPYWWNVGDTVFGVHDPGTGDVTHADVILKISYNVLSGSGHVDLDFQIDGTTVGSVSVTPADGEGYVMASFDFPPMTPPFELRWISTNTVDPGAGSVSLDETGECLVDFGGILPVETRTLSEIKHLYD